MKIDIGTTFNYTHADGRPKWTVIEKRGRGTWIAEVVTDDEWAGTKKAFSTEEISQAIGMALYWQKSMNDSDKFFVKLTPGSIVHYSNGYNQYVRCKVTADHQLLPIALVGEWNQYDLPKRMPNGEIYNGYHAQTIVDGKVFKPHASHMYEFSHRPEAINPVNLKPVDISVPDITATEAVSIAKHRKLDAIRLLVNHAGNNLDVIFDQIRAELAKA